MEHGATVCPDDNVIFACFIGGRGRDGAWQCTVGDERTGYISQKLGWWWGKLAYCRIAAKLQNDDVRSANINIVTRHFTLHTASRSLLVTLTTIQNKQDISSLILLPPAALIPRPALSTEENIRLRVKSPWLSWCSGGGEMARATVRQWRVKTPAATFHLHYPEIFSKYSLHSTQPPGQSTLAWERGWRGNIASAISASLVKSRIFWPLWSRLKVCMWPISSSAVCPESWVVHPGGGVISSLLYLCLHRVGSAPCAAWPVVTGDAAIHTLIRHQYTL